MPAADLIIPGRYSPHQLTHVIDPALRQKHDLAFELAMNAAYPQLHALLTKPAREALSLLKPGNEHAVKLIQAHAKTFPGRYQMPVEVSTYFLDEIYLRAIGGGKINPAAEFVRIPLTPTMAVLLAAGANPFFVLSRAKFTPQDIDRYLSVMPATAAKDRSGFTLAHVYCRYPDFVAATLPVLMKYGVDINSVGDDPPLGTFMHTMLANEEHEAALAFLRAPITNGLVDPRARDGEGKTMPIIAAKTLSETVLLELAHKYPGKLDINAQDNEGRTVMHYIFAFGLIDAARFYMGLNPDLTLKDRRGRAPVDYFKLTTPETGDILRSIEIHPSRDAGAKFNAITISGTNNSVLNIDGKPQLAISKNFTPSLRNMILRHFGEAEAECFDRQRNQLQRVSLLSVVLKRREQLYREYRNGLLAPAAASPTIPAASPPDATP